MAYSRYISFGPTFELRTGPHTIYRDFNHHHFWIRDGHLFETFETIKGIRHKHRLSVPGMPDEDICSEACINYIEKEYLSPHQ